MGASLEDAPNPVRVLKKTHMSLFSPFEHYLLVATL